MKSCFITGVRFRIAANGGSWVQNGILSVDTLRTVRSFRADGVPKDTQKNPLRTQLGFMLAPKNTLIYLGHAPGQTAEGRIDLKSSVHLISYQIDSDTFQDHGPLLTQDDRRIFFTESVALATDGHFYTVAWVETTNQARAKKIRAARGQAGPAETDEAVYEIQLVQLEKAISF